MRMGAAILVNSLPLPMNGKAHCGSAPDMDEMKGALLDDEIRRPNPNPQNRCGNPNPVRREIGVAKGKAEEVFASMDSNKSGAITFEEFRNYFSTKQELSSVL